MQYNDKIRSFRCDHEDVLHGTTLHPTKTCVCVCMCLQGYREAIQLVLCVLLPSFSKDMKLLHKLVIEGLKMRLQMYLVCYLQYVLLHNEEGEGEGEGRGRGRRRYVLEWESLCVCLCTWAYTMNVCAWVYA